MELQQILMKIMELSFKINTETKYCVTSNYCGYSNSIHVSVLKDKESIDVTLFSNLYFYESEHGDYGEILNYLQSLLND